MAYENKISILIQAQDEASAVITAAAEQAKAAQSDVALATEESAARQQEAVGQVAGSVEEAQRVIIAGNEELASATTASMDEAIAAMKEYGDVAAETAAKTAASSDATVAGAVAGTAAGGGISKSVGMTATVIAAAVAVAAGVMVKAAGDFQKSVTQIYSSAGETAPFETISSGILQIARDTGTATQQLTNGLYTISSAGYNAASGLTILRASAEGAKAENADLGTVTDALTTIMHDYGYGTNQAYSVTNMMIAAVSAGKMHLQDFASSLSTVLPIAHSVGLSFAQVAGAEATLTAAGVSANQATQDLHSVISTLIAPTAQQVTAMQAMGLSSVQLSQDVGKVGLTGTLQEMFDAITQHMGPSGLVIQNAMKNATLASQDLQTELAAMPTSLQNLAQQLLNGTISFTDYKKEVQALPEGLANLGKQFEATYNQTQSFNSQLMAGVNASPTFTNELKQMTGQSNSMNAVLMLTGNNAATFSANVNSISKAAKDAGGNISSWGDIQGNFNQKMSELKEDVGTTGIAIGQALLPPLTSLMSGIGDILGPIGNFVDNNQALTAVVLLGAGGLATFVAITWAAQKATDAVSNSFSFATGLAKKFASAIGLIDTTEESGGLNKVGAELTGIGNAAKGTVPEVEAVASAVGTEGGGVGLVGALGALGPAGVLAGVAIAGVTVLGVSHWKDVKGAVDDVGKSISNVLGTGSSAPTAPAKTVAQSQSAVATGVSTTVKDEQGQESLMQSLSTQTEALAKARGDLADKTSAYNTAVEKAASDYSKYGGNSKQEQTDLATVSKLSGEVADAQKKVSDAQNAVATTSKMLSANNLALTNTVSGVKAAINDLPPAHTQVKKAQDAVSDSTDKVNAKQKDLTTAVALFGPQAGKGNVKAQQDIKTAQDNLVGSLKEGKSKSDDLKDATNNQSTAFQTAKYWADQHDQKIKDLGLDAKTTTGLVDNLNNALSNTNSDGAAKGGFWNDLKSIFHFATGTNYAPGGLAMVGEQGPELVNLPRGSQVLTNSETNAVLGSSGGRNVVIQQLNVNNNVDAGLVVRQIGWKLATA